MAKLELIKPSKPILKELTLISKEDIDQAMGYTLEQAVTSYQICSSRKKSREHKADWARYEELFVLFDYVIKYRRYEDELSKYEALLEEEEFQKELKNGK